MISCWQPPPRSLQPCVPVPVPAGGSSTPSSPRHPSAHALGPGCSSRVLYLFCATDTGSNSIFSYFISTLTKIHRN